MGRKALPPGERKKQHQVRLSDDDRRTITEGRAAAAVARSGVAGWLRDVGLAVSGQTLPIAVRAWLNEHGLLR